MRPSCGWRFSAMSSARHDLVRDTITPLHHLRRLDHVAQHPVPAEAHTERPSKASTWMSEAPSRTACENRALISRTMAVGPRSPGGRRPWKALGDAALARAYEPARRTPPIRGRHDANPDLVALAESLPKVADLLESEDDAPIVRLINALFSQAVREGASDIHVEAFEGRSVVRFRRDGIAARRDRAPQVVHGVIVSRIKIMARLDIAGEAPTAGRPHRAAARRALGRRARFDPADGSRRARGAATARQAGREARPHRARHGGLRRSPPCASSSGRPHGIILVTGPTGSGKTTTLYAALGQLDAKRTNIVTVEDPNRIRPRRPSARPR